MDQSLDEIISSRPKTRGVRRGGGRRGSARAQVLGTAATPAGRARAAAVAPTTVATTATARPAAATNAIAEKIMVSNLPQDVNEAQIKELFHSTVGPLKEVTLHYDSAGRSKGVANVWFSRRGDGTKAYQQYNNRLIDGS